ncbi:MAG: hypothetical protein MUP53_07980 [Bacteroidales bacterium]|nr:hypothetical protein [Bacteroidales bacterium]
MNAGLIFDDIGIIINTGVYNESHLREPAVSALIQKQLETSGKPGEIVLRKGLVNAMDLMNVPILADNVMKGKNHCSNNQA